MDVIDSGADTAQFFLDCELRKQRGVGTLMPYTGKCYNCEEEVEAPACFCGPECQEDFEKRATVHKKTHYSPVVS